MGSYPVVLAGYRPLCMSVACCYYIHCRKYISLTAKNIFHCRKHISLPKIYRYFTAKQQKEKNMTECETLKYILSDFKSKLKPRVKCLHPKGYCIIAAELKGQDSEDTPCRNNRLERKTKLKSW